MKKFLTLLAINSLVFANEPPAKPIDPTTHIDPTTQYRDKKADLAIIHDAYYEAQPYEGELPAPWKRALEKFGFKESDVHFYTAVRTNCFVERVGNFLIILRPNFTLYCTDAEQEVYIGLRLAELKAGEKDTVGGSHGTFYKPGLSLFQKKTFGAAAVVLGVLYHRELWEQGKYFLPKVKDILLSKGAAVVGICLAAQGIKQMNAAKEEARKVNAAEDSVVEHLGAEGLLSIREKQVHWGYKKHSWIVNKLYRIFGEFGLVYNPEASLARIKARLAQQK